MVARLPMLVGIAVWLLGIEVISESWYRFREGDRGESVSWSLQWPAEGESFRFNKIPEEARSILRYTEGASGVIDRPDGSTWQMFFFRWEPGRSSVQLATMHRPEICLPAAGFKFVSNMPRAEVAIEGVRFTFDGSVFESNGSGMYVFRCLWEDQPVSGISGNRLFDMSIMGRLKSAWYGRRNLGQKLLQIGIVGAQSEQGARADLLNGLPPLIVMSR